MKEYPKYKMFIVGIDPGIHGGISGLDTEKNLLWSVETPTTIPDPKTKKHEYDIPRIAALLKACQPDLICLEAVHSMPGQGVSSTFLFGKGFGILLGVIGTLGIPLKMVTPRVWKKSFSITADKQTSRDKATELFPDCSKFWKLKKHDGLAESSLLAVFGSGMPTIDLIKMGDIYELYQIKANSSDRRPVGGTEFRSNARTKTR